MKTVEILMGWVLEEGLSGGFRYKPEILTDYDCVSVTCKTELQHMPPNPNIAAFEVICTDEVFELILLDVKYYVVEVIE